MADPAVSFRDVVKRFRMRNRSDSLRDAIPRLLARVFRGRESAAKRFDALKGVSFEVAKGEVLGIVGANGAGKSTILRLAAGIYPPTSGEVRIGGAVSALIELSAGFHPDLSGKENIYLAGALHGLRRREIAEVLGLIAEFADIGEYLESPVRTYSSGMAVRLGFAVAAHVPAEILLVDEVLAVGDMDFRAKCLRRMTDRRNEGTAVVFVSHNLSIVEQFCDRVVFLEQGEVVRDGAPRESIDAYRKSAAASSRDRHVRESATPRLRRGTGEFTLEEIRIVAADGSGAKAVPAGAPLRVEGRWKAASARACPILGISVVSLLGIPCLEVTSDGRTGLPETVEGEGTFTVEVPALALRPAEYEISVFAREAGTDAILDHHQCLYPLTVGGEAPAGSVGLLSSPSEWSITRG